MFCLLAQMVGAMTWNLIQFLNIFILQIWKQLSIIIKSYEVWT